jgi:hypothetical protein
MSQLRTAPKIALGGGGAARRARKTARGDFRKHDRRKTTPASAQKPKTARKRPGTAADRFEKAESGQEFVRFETVRLRTFIGNLCGG